MNGVNWEDLAERWRAAGEPQSVLHPAVLLHLRHSRVAGQLTRIARETLWECTFWGLLTFLMGGLLASQQSFYALLCHVYAIGMFAMSIREWVAARTLDIADPVAVALQRLEGVRVCRMQRLQWGLLGGTVIWAPCTLVLWQFLTGIRVGHSGTWVVVNIGFGLVMACAALVISRRYARGNQFWRALSGEGVAEAEEALQRLREFQE